MIDRFKKLQGSKGFTLLELLVVVAIIGILATLILANLNSARKRANDAKVQSDIKAISQAIELYVSNYSDNSTLMSGLTSLSGLKTSLTSYPTGDPLLKSFPAHPKGSTFEYNYTGTVAGTTLNYTISGDLVSKTGCFSISNGQASTSATACP